jgi:hypothetical protein
MARTTNEKPIKLNASFTQTLRTLLQTPPPPAGTPRGRAKQARTQKRLIQSTTRKLKTQFAAAHRDGMAALREGDYRKLGLAIERERALVEKQKELIAAQKRRLAKQRLTRQR